MIRIRNHHCRRHHFWPASTVAWTLQRVEPPYEWCLAFETLVCRCFFVGLFVVTK